MAQIIIRSDNETKAHASNVVNKEFYNCENLAIGQLKHFTFFRIWFENCTMNIPLNISKGCGSG